MKRLLFVADSLMAGGIESQLIELVTRLDRNVYDIHILSLYGPTARNLHYLPVLQQLEIPVITPDLGWSTRDKLRGWQEIRAQIRRLRPDIIQTEGYHANLLTRLAFPFPHGTKLIGSVRGLHSQKQLLYERISHRTCNSIVVNAPHLQTMLVQKANIPVTKIPMILNGIDIEHFATPYDPDYCRQLTADSTHVFVSLGRVSFEKNLHWTAEAFGLLHERGQLPANTKVYFAGAIQDTDAQILLEQTIARYGLQGIIFQHAATQHPEDYYAASTATILYSPAEGLPNVCIESLAAGRPVIISTTANAANIITQGKTGWIVPVGDPKQLAERIATTLTLAPSELEHMRNLCSVKSQDFAVEAMVQKYDELYQSL